MPYRSVFERHSRLSQGAKTHVAWLACAVLCCAEALHGWKCVFGHLVQHFLLHRVRLPGARERFQRLFIAGMVKC